MSDDTPHGRPRDPGAAVRRRAGGDEVSARDDGIEHAHLFGEVWARPGLSLRDRELITVSVIAALGRERQLRLHLRGALNAGLTREELIEDFMHLAYYAGYPAGFTALAIAKEVFDAVDAEAAATG